MAAVKMYERAKELEAAYTEDGTDIALFLVLWEDLCEFLTSLGTVFGFIVSDINKKVSIIQEYQQTEPDKKTLQSLIQMEIDTNQTIRKGHPPSASRTILRLNRALEFIECFLSALSEAPSDESSATVARAAYDKTLSKHHAWLVRKTVGAALYTLSSRETLLTQLCGEIPEDEQAAMMKNLCKSLDSSYQAIKKIYDEHKLHELP
eukprot:m.339655 g.339655  ORF g.339655 m.339655 type:complete len:206 (-) comp18900_c0_seq1:173-790(-)